MGNPFLRRVLAGVRKDILEDLFDEYLYWEKAEAYWYNSYNWNYGLVPDEEEQDCWEKYREARHKRVALGATLEEGSMDIKGHSSANIVPNDFLLPPDGIRVVSGPITTLDPAVYTLRDAVPTSEEIVRSVLARVNFILFRMTIRPETVFFLDINSEDIRLFQETFPNMYIPERLSIAFRFSREVPTIFKPTRGSKRITRSVRLKNQPIGTFFEICDSLAVLTEKIRLGQWTFKLIQGRRAGEVHVYLEGDVVMEVLLQEAFADRRSGKSGRPRWTEPYFERTCLPEAELTVNAEPDTSNEDFSFSVHPSTDGSDASPGIAGFRRPLEVSLPEAIPLSPRSPRRSLR